MSYESDRYLFFEYVSGEDIIYTEGANWEYFKSCYRFQKEFNKEFKNAKKMMRKKNFAEALKSCKNAEKMIADVKKEIESQDSDAGVLGVISGILLSVLIRMGTNAAASSAGRGLGIRDDSMKRSISTVNKVYDLDHDIRTIRRWVGYNKNGKSLNKHDLNTFRNDVLNTIDACERNLMKLEKKIQKKMNRV